MRATLLHLFIFTLPCKEFLEKLIEKDPFLLVVAILTGKGSDFFFKTRVTRM